MRSRASMARGTNASPDGHQYGTDMITYTTLSGGLVFSVGSLSLGSSLIQDVQARSGTLGLGWPTVAIRCAESGDARVIVRSLFISFTPRRSASIACKGGVRRASGDQNGSTSAIFQLPVTRCTVPRSLPAA